MASPNSGTNRPIATSCGICGKLFSWASSLALHMRIHTGEKPYKCEQCGKQFTQKVHLQRHQLVHQQSSVVSNSSNAQLPVFNPDSFNQYLMASIEPNTFQQSVANTTTIYPPVENSISPKAAKKEKKNSKIECVECHQRFSTKLLMMEHLCEAHSSVGSTVRNNSKSSYCRFCDKTFASPSSLGLHMRSHTGERPYQCRFCGKAFIQNVHLKAHLAKHTGEKPYTCRYCNKCFAISYSLKVHENIHIGRRIHTCSVCKKAFFQQYQLMRHMMCHIRHRGKNNISNRPRYRPVAKNNNPPETQQQPSPVVVKLEPIDNPTQKPYENISSCETDCSDEGLPAITTAVESCAKAEEIPCGSTNGPHPQQPQNCAKCGLLEGELQLLRTELQSIRQFLGHKFTLMDQRMEGMLSLT